MKIDAAALAPPPTLPLDADQMVDWLIDSVQLEATVFHIGQYCGRWQASTAGRALGSYHLILHGSCYLHIDGFAPVLLNPRDSVFMLRDIPHFLSPEPGVDAGSQPNSVLSAMQPLAAPAADATGIACGFFHFRDAVSALIVDSFPDYLVLRADDAFLQAPRALFELILAETPRALDAPSPLVARLAELMFFYVIRHLAQRQEIAGGLLAVARRPAFTHLLERMMQAPGDNWSTDNMARASNMSRSSFYKHFSDASGQAPAQFQLLLRMKIAASRLGGGDTVERTAAHVGYRSYAAFSRAFKKITGDHPGAFRRAHLTPTGGAT